MSIYLFCHDGSLAELTDGTAVTLRPDKRLRVRAKVHACGGVAAMRPGDWGLAFAKAVGFPLTRRGTLDGEYILLRCRPRSGLGGLKAGTPVAIEFSEAATGGAGAKVAGGSRRAKRCRCEMRLSAVHRLVDRPGLAAVFYPAAKVPPNEFALLVFRAGGWEKYGES